MQNINEIRGRIKEILIAPRETSHPADDLLDEFIIIPKYDLPDFTVIERKGEAHVDCGSDWGTWDVAHVAAMKKTALEYVGAWLTAEQWHAEQEEARMTRRDELAAEFTNAGTYAEMGPAGQKLIDRIIELEAKVTH